MKSTLKRWALRSTLFSVAFIIFCYWTFPYERVAAYVIQQVEYPAGPGGVRLPSGIQLEIGELSPHWLSGVELEDVRLVHGSDHADVPAGVVEVSHLLASVSILPLLSGTVEADLEMETGSQGQVSGRVRVEGSESWSTRLEISELRLEELGVIRSYTGLPFTGTLSGLIDFTVPSEVTNATGEVGLTLRGMVIGGDGAKLRVGRRGPLAQGLTVDPINAGDLALTASAEGGVLNLDELSARGDDLTLCGNGSLQLNPRLAASRINTLLRVEFGTAYRTRSEITEALFAALQFNPQARRAQTEDESAYQFRLDGNIGGRVRFAPAGRADSPCAAGD